MKNIILSEIITVVGKEISSDIISVSREIMLSLRNYYNVCYVYYTGLEDIDDIIL